VLNQAAFDMQSERLGDIALKGKPLAVLGPVLRPGDRAVEVILSGKGFDGAPALLASIAGKFGLINVVPSLGASICDAQTRRLDQEAAGLGEDVRTVIVGVDLPFAQADWCAAKGVDQVVMLSDNRHMASDDAHGTPIKELPGEQRSACVVDRDGIVRYVEYVPEIAQHSDYEAVLSAARNLLGRSTNDA
jgi:thioredoxin-dependent peroxiredoxin